MKYLYLYLYPNELRSLLVLKEMAISDERERLDVMLKEDIAIIEKEIQKCSGVVDGFKSKGLQT